MGNVLDVTELIISASGVLLIKPQRGGKINFPSNPTPVFQNKPSNLADTLSRK
jgi:hypothetical protein